MTFFARKSGSEVVPEAGHESRDFSWSLVVNILGFGLLAAWLDLGTSLARAAFWPLVSVDEIRTNRHKVWMLPISDLLIMIAVGFVIAIIGFLRPSLARWLASRVPLAMFLGMLLLNLDGLHVMAALTLATGMASITGPWIGRRRGRNRWLVPVSVSVMILGLVVLAGVSYARVVSAERRALASCPPAKPGAPNVLLIVLDTVRASSLSLHGHERPTSPNIERLASQGIVFNEARATSSWTAPTHGSLMTGRWAHELSISSHSALDGKYPTLAETLAKAGYATAGFVGNIFYCNSVFGIDRGFAHYEDAYENQSVTLFEILWSSNLGRRLIRALGYSTDFDDGVTLRRKTAAMLNQDVLGWIKGRPNNRPFFVFINYYDAHRPYFLPSRTESRFGSAALPIERRKELERRFQKTLTGECEPNDPDVLNIQMETVALYRDCYDTCIASIDRQIGRLVDELRSEGLMDNTLVVVTSDHGEHLGERGLIGHGVSVYRPEAHVPLVILPPSRLPASRIVNRPVSLREIPATIAECVGLGERNPFPGRSLTRVLDASAKRVPGKSPVLCELEEYIAFSRSDKIPAGFGPVRSLTSGNHVYIRWDTGNEEVYDIHNDPFELVDLGKDPDLVPVIARFRAEIKRLLPDLSTAINSP